MMYHESCESVTDFYKTHRKYRPVAQNSNAQDTPSIVNGSTDCSTLTEILQCSSSYATCTWLGAKATWVIGRVFGRIGFKLSDESRSQVRYNSALYSWNWCFVLSISISDVVARNKWHYLDLNHQLQVTYGKILHSSQYCNLFICSAPSHPVCSWNNVICSQQVVIFALYRYLSPSNNKTKKEPFPLITKNLWVHGMRYLTTRVKKHRETLYKYFIIFQLSAPFFSVGSIAWKLTGPALRPLHSSHPILPRRCYDTEHLEQLDKSTSFDAKDYKSMLDSLSRQPYFISVRWSR